MRHLVLGGTGTVGSAVVEKLLEHGEEVRVPSRSEERLDELPDAVEGVVGDLGDPSTYDAIFRDFDRLFLLNAVSPSELQEGLVALEEARKADIDRVVYLSVHRAETGDHVPHFASKVAVERALEGAGIPYTVLRPNNFFQNDLWFREAIVDHGVYPQPIGSVGLSRVDVDDIAEAAVNALLLPGHLGETYPLVGPDALTGEDCARVWSEATGREVAYSGDDLDAWSEQALQMLPGWMVYDFRMMYRLFQEEGLAATRGDLDATRRILGRRPRSFEDWATEAAEGWR